MCNMIQLASKILESTPGRKLGRSRLIRTVYLCDWKAAIVSGEQMTSAHWELHNCGPYSMELKEAIEARSDIFCVDPVNRLGITMNMVSLVRPTEYESFHGIDTDVLNFILDTVRDLDWMKFNRLVNSTYPAFTLDTEQELNLVELARDYLHSLAKDEAERLKTLQVAGDDSCLLAAASAEPVSEFS